jgi:hypothetical protein
VLSEPGQVPPSADHFFEVRLGLGASAGARAFAGDAFEAVGAGFALLAFLAFRDRPILYRVNLTLIGGDLARTVLPARSCAGVNRVLIAQATAALPNPWPGSRTISADVTEPSGPTTTRMTTVCSSIRSESASGGHGQDQL